MAQRRGSSSWARLQLCLNIIFTRMLRLQYDNRYYPFNVQNESVVFLVEYSTRLLSASASVLFQISLILLLSSNHYLDQPPPISRHTYIKLKEVKDVLGGTAAWENSSETRLHAHGLPALREQASIPHADSD